MFLFLVDGVLFGVAVHKNQDQLINIYIYKYMQRDGHKQNHMCFFFFISWQGDHSWWFYVERRDLDSHATAVALVVDPGSIDSI